MNAQAQALAPVAGLVSRSPYDDPGGREFLRAVQTAASGSILLTAQTRDGSLAAAQCVALDMLSASPPVVQCRLSCDAGGMQVFAHASHFAVNVMGVDQAALLRHFATRGGDRFSAVAFEFGEGGAPLLEGAVATLECASQPRDEGAGNLILLGQVLKYRQACFEPLSITTGAPPHV